MYGFAVMLKQSIIEDMHYKDSINLNKFKVLLFKRDKTSWTTLTDLI